MLMSRSWVVCSYDILWAEANSNDQRRQLLPEVKRRGAALQPGMGCKTAAPARRHNHDHDLHILGCGDTNLDRSVLPREQRHHLSRTKRKRLYH